MQDNLTVPQQKDDRSKKREIILNKFLYKIIIKKKTRTNL